MRSSKSRSRSKQNRPRTLGNIINRVFDSSGPEGKVRGTPQQIIEKYQLLARDAQLSNDRVAAENFLQHAEHYTRLLAEAMREQAAEQEARQQQINQQPGNGQRDRYDRGDRAEYRGEGRSDQSGDRADLAPEGFNVVGGDEEANLVELPEAPRAQPQPPRRDDRRDDRNREPRRDDRPREERPRDDRPREERSRDDRPRDERPREERPREERPRDDRRREDRPREQRRREPDQAELPAFITGAPAAAAVTEAPAQVVSDEPIAIVKKPAKAPAVEAVAVEVVATEAKPARAPRARKPAAPKGDEVAKPETPEAAE